MKYYMNKIFLLAFIAFAMSSCTKYLDVKTYGKAIPKTSEEFSALLHTHLNSIDYGEDHPLLENASELLNMEVITDNFSVPLTLPSGTVLPRYVGSLLNNKQSRYERLYEVIRDANIIINNMKDVTGSEDKNVMGTAYAIRAIAYYHLLREYCEPYETDSQLGLPIVQDFDMEERPTRSTYGQTKAFILADLEKALSYKVSDEIYRYTEDVTKAYLARFYFWTKDWENAARLAQDIVKKYPLLSGNEYKMMLSSKNEKVGNVLMKSYLFSGSTDITYNTSQELWKSRPLSNSFVKIFTEGNKDIRFDLTMNNKRIALKVLNGKVRSAEFQFVLAESLFHLGKSDLALKEVNYLRAKRINGYVDLGINDLPAVDTEALIKVDAEGKALTPLMQLILNERRKELFGEGDRFFELKRNGRPVFWAADNGLKYTTEKFMYTFPIPRMDVEVIQGLIQNEGYTF